jgi:retron-type reverse transcriptase
MECKLALEVRKQKTIEAAWSAIHRNARTSKSQVTKEEIAAFEAELSKNLKRIRRQLQEKKFVFKPARGIKIPKKDKASFRPLVVAKVESRIVQRAIHDVLVSQPAIHKFVRTPYSFGGVRKEEGDDLASVPAAIRAVLSGIERGAKYVIRSDISQFFTRIPKSAVTTIVKQAVNDQEFIELFTQSISVELENMAQLREAAKAFPIEDIGVAQGNSLSPLLGNLILYDFDAELNKQPDVTCIRFIDDFLILGPNNSVVSNTYDKAKHLLAKLGMSVSEPKTQKSSVREGFEFLGIELANGFIRPTKDAQQSVLSSIESTLAESYDEFVKFPNSGALPIRLSLLRTLERVAGIMQGWGKHYRFCNDSKCFELLDEKISEHIRKYLSIYRESRKRTDANGYWRLLGIEALAQIEREPFMWPKK